MSMTRQEVSTWTDEVVNLWLADAIGLKLRGVRFTDSFDDLFASTRHDSVFDGPVAWLMEASRERHTWLASVSWILHEQSGWCICERGPRALANACVVAISEVKEKRQ
ncbi:MAG: hypothetical protein PHR35_22330 [Kiritimatiellae bacterium]|nr:hypothetical protein [Kiritimatiellia bacterium]